MTVQSIRCLTKLTYALAVSTILLMGCAGALGGLVKMYPGSERPASEVSVIKCGFSLVILAVDSSRTSHAKPNFCEYALLPGKHSFRVRIEKQGVGFSWVQKGDQVVEYDLKAGKSYGLHAFEDKKSPGLWTISITDPVTDKIVPLKQVNLQ
ncbi:MAG: hypothetical protein HY080_06065 [Gammaproteobacteria bacterium]|nr:hypothetical protein [Gammaproteobacteria bacterium]